MAEHTTYCELCASTGGELLWENALCRVVNIDDPDYPGFCRVILNRHVAEMTDLDGEEPQEIMRIVFSVEATLRHLLNPDKINLASLGNMTPHVHWHVIPRWREDRCFPHPIWGAAQRTVPSVSRRIGNAELKTALSALLGLPILARMEDSP